VKARFPIVNQGKNYHNFVSLGVIKNSSYKE